MPSATVAPFSSPHLAAIFSHDIFTSHNFRSPYQFWLPLISLFSGLRPSEVAQLHLDDIKLGGDIWYINVNATPPRKLTSHYSSRRIPVHSALIDLGFLVFIEELKKADEKVLFPELWRSSILDTWTSSKRFRHVLAEVGVAGRGLSIASFRTTAANVYTRVGYNQNITLEVFGFPITNITAACFAAPTRLSVLKDAIEVLNASSLGFAATSTVKPWVTGCVERSKTLRKMQQAAPGISISEDDLTSAVRSIPNRKKRRV